MEVYKIKKSEIPAGKADVVEYHDELVNQAVTEIGWLAENKMKMGKDIGVEIEEYLAKFKKKVKVVDWQGVKKEILNAVSFMLYEYVY